MRDQMRARPTRLVPAVPFRLRPRVTLAAVVEDLVLVAHVALGVVLAFGVAGHGHVGGGGLKPDN